MLKKSLIGAGIALTLGAFVFGKDVFSYARTAGSSVRNAVKSEVPIEFEVQRAREMVENLVPDIRRCMHVIAEQQVDIEHLQREIARKDTELEQQKTAILALRQDLDSGDSTFVYASRTYTSDEVKRDLANRFGRYKVAKESLDRDSEILDARRQALAANEKRLDNMLASKQQLEVKVEQLEARLKTLQATQSVATIEFDDSQLVRAKKLIAELDKQLDVEQRLQDADGKFTELIPVDAEPPVPADITGQIDSYFDDGVDTESPDLAEIELEPAA